jgi:uncharacterized protein YegP (UPF0339 family)
MKFHIYQDKRGEWRWRLKARNGRIVADSGEGYVRKSGAYLAALRVVNGAQDADLIVEKTK